MPELNEIKELANTQNPVLVSQAVQKIVPFLHDIYSRLDDLEANISDLKQRLDDLLEVLSL